MDGGLNFIGNIIKIESNEACIIITMLYNVYY